MRVLLIIVGLFIGSMLMIPLQSWYSQQGNLPEDYNKVTALYSEKVNDSGICIWYKDFIDDGDYIIINEYYTGKDWPLGSYKYSNKVVRVSKESHVYASGISNFQYVDNFEK